MEEVTATEATSLAGVTLQGKPQIPAAAYAKILKADGSAFRAMSQTYAISQSLAIMMFAKGGKWEATSSGLKVSYDGGEATFAAKPTVARQELQRKADVFNSLSHAAGEVASPYVPPVIPRSKNPGVIQLPSKPTPTPEMRAPSFPDKLRN